MFESTYVCERRFSIMKQVKSQDRNGLADETPDHSLRFSTTNIFLLRNDSVREASTTGIDRDL